MIFSCQVHLFVDYRSIGGLMMSLFFFYLKGTGKRGWVTAVLASDFSVLEIEAIGRKPFPIDVSKAKNIPEPQR